jgi:hypothetical protein
MLKKNQASGTGSFSYMTVKKEKKKKERKK